jgi:hypothetical protein
MMMIVRGLLVSGLLLLCAATVGCGESKLDTDQAESAIRVGITRQTGVKIDSVRCPDDVKVRRGDTFRCTARASNGQRAAVEVTQRDDEGSVSWRLVRRR